jgi:hypothetical protein
MIAYEQHSVSCDMDDSMGRVRRHIGCTKAYSFEDFLKQKHYEEHPMLIDDDLPDAFDNWLGEIDGEDYMKYGQEYGEYLIEQITK